jgi:lysophospholipase L1-like esterase
MVFQKDINISYALRCVSGIALLVSAANAAAIECRYTVSNDWDSGFTSTITITNDSQSAITGWQVQWRQNGGSIVTSSWNANVSGANPYIASSVEWNGRIAPGAAQSFGVQGNGDNSTATIVGCTAEGGNTSSQSTSSVSNSILHSSNASSTMPPLSSSPRSSVRSSSMPSSRASSPPVSSSGGVNDNYTFCANEGETCRFTETREVRFGAQGKYSYAVATGSLECNSQNFIDPIRDVVKACYYSNETTSASELTIQENSAGFCSVDGSIDSNNAGFTGSGFANADNTTTAGINYSIHADSAGSVMLDIRFATITSRPTNIEVNGIVAGAVNFASTGAWTSWTNENIIVRLQTGKNIVRLVPRTAGGLPNVDSLKVIGNGLNAGLCNAAPDSCSNFAGSGNSLSTCKGDPAICLLGGGVGNYRVSMKFNVTYDGEIEVFAESRRRMYSSPRQNTATARCVDFLVNVRDPEGQPYQADRGTAGLNLRITKGFSALTGLTFTPAGNPRTLFIAGDSTVADQTPQLNLAAGSRFSGWGQFIPAYFNDGIAISNYADSGESTAAFRTDGGGLWNPINARLKSGDWVMIQLGHNDKTTAASLYRSRITNMVAAIRAKGANPILITPMIRNTGDLLSSQHIWGDLNIRNELIRVANAQNVPLVDLMKLSSDWAARIGRNPAQAYFVANDRTHSNEIGAELFAEMIVNEILQQKIGIVDYIRQP